ncbi:unnamed protein product, partial [Symbiodinium pilosum]
EGWTCAGSDALGSALDCSFEGWLVWAGYAWGFVVDSRAGCGCGWTADARLDFSAGCSDGWCFGVEGCASEDFFSEGFSLEGFSSGYLF